LTSTFLVMGRQVPLRERVRPRWRNPRLATKARRHLACPRAQLA